jgi:hypothetical protein
MNKQNQKIALILFVLIFFSQFLWLVLPKFCWASDDKIFAIDVDGKLLKKSIP